MCWQGFLSNVIDSIAWPIVALIGIWLMKKPLCELIPLLTKFKFAGAEAEFGQSLEEARAQLEENVPDISRSVDSVNPELNKLLKVAQHSPTAAIMDSWRLVEQAIRKAATRQGYDDIRHGKGSATIASMQRHLQRNNDLSRAVTDFFHELRNLRNQAAHIGDVAINTADAMQYIDLALSLVQHYDNLLPGQ
jgi:hypothetical protein